MTITLLLLDSGVCLSFSKEKKAIWKEITSQTTNTKVWTWTNFWIQKKLTNHQKLYQSIHYNHDFNFFLFSTSENIYYGVFFFKKKLPNEKNGAVQSCFIPMGHHKQNTIFHGISLFVTGELRVPSLQLMNLNQTAISISSDFLLNKSKKLRKQTVDRGEGKQLEESIQNLLNLFTDACRNN